MTISRTTRYLLISLMSASLTFIYLPLSVVIINSFNISRIFSWPPRQFTTVWWEKAIANTGVREALLWSLSAGAIAASVALILGKIGRAHV